MITCSFAGHREVYQPGIEDDLDAILSNLIESNADSFSFLVGGMGKFDRSNLGEDCEVGKFRLDRDNEEC